MQALYYSSQINQAPPPKRSKRRICLVLLIVIVIIPVAFLLIDSWHHHRVRAAKTGIDQLSQQQTFTDINHILAAQPQVSYAIAAQDLTNGKQISINASTPMTAASVSKLLTAADFLLLCQQGQESTQETLEDGNLASDDINQMITVSSDSAWEALNDEVSYDQLQDYADSLGLNSYNAQTNTLSAQDTLSLYQRLYQNKLLSAPNTDLLLSYLKVANYRQFILPALPADAVSFHKVGEYNDNVNDAAIVQTKHNQAVIVIFTDGHGSGDWTARAATLQQITKLILDYFNLH